MKNLFYLCLTFAVVALSACSDDEQSSLNFDDIQGKAVIKGVVTIIQAIGLMEVRS